MMQIFWMALKDLKILFRDPVGAFFIVGFPILMGVFFGLIMGGNGSSGNTGKSRLAVVDLDQSDISRRFVAELGENENLEIEKVADVSEAKESVRRGQKVGMLVIPEGFGKTAGMLWMPPPKLQIGMDPSRSAESAMIEGMVMQAMGSLIAIRFQNPDQILPSLDEARQQVASADNMNPVTRQLFMTFFGTIEQLVGNVEQLNEADEDNDSPLANEGFQFVDLEKVDVTRTENPDSPRAELKKLKSRWDISFPQGMMWGILGCIAGFSISIAQERTRGTMMRLQVAPVTRFHILAGKALACFLTVMGVVAMLTALGMFLGMRPSNFGLLVVAAFSVAICFVGVMMALSVVGKTEQSVSGIGWAINLVMAMFGGAMVPVMFMPEFIQKLSILSPVKWGLLAIEGAIWREFSLSEMVLPCSILIGIGVVGMVIGTAVLSRRQ